MYKRQEHETVALGEECSIMVLNQLDAKLKDPDSFSIRCRQGVLAFIGPYVIFVLVLV